jgi:hypothetical protein
VIAGHGPALALAAERADGANTYLVTAAHAKSARAILGPAKALRVVLPFIGEPDPERAARRPAPRSRSTVAPAYHRLVVARLRGGRLDGRAERPPGRCDHRLGHAERIRERAREYLAAGATQVLSRRCSACDSARLRSRRSKADEA